PASRTTPAGLPPRPASVNAAYRRTSGVVSAGWIMSTSDPMLGVGCGGVQRRSSMGPIGERKRGGMDTELLRTFCAVVRTRSFTAAARELGYVQSTVTGHVQALERRLGVRLLDRLPTGAIPTDAGRRLTPLARQVLDLENRIRTEVPADGDEPAGPVHLIAPESVCAYRLPALITRLRAEAPQVRLVLTPGGAAAALAAARDGTTDVAVGREPVLAVPDLDVRTVGTEAVVLLAAPAGDRARRWTWADLAERETLLLEEGCSYGDQAARHLVAAGQP